MELSRLLLEGAGAVILMIATFFLYKVSERLDRLSTEIADLRVEMMRNYVLKEEFTTMRTRVHEISNNLSKLMMAFDLEQFERRKEPRS